MSSPNEEITGPFTGMPTRKDCQIAENREVLGVCLIAKRLHGVYIGVCSGFVVEVRTLFKNWKRPVCVITDGQTDWSNRQDYRLYFKELPAWSGALGERLYELEHVTSSKDAITYSSGLAIIPLDDNKLKKLLGIRKSGILTYRPFPVKKKESLDGSVCYIIDGGPYGFTVKPYDLEYVNEEYILKLPGRCFQTFSQLTSQGANNLHPHGAVILKMVKKTVVAVGALSFVHGKISPVSFSQLTEIADVATSSQPVTTDVATSSQPVTTDGATSSQPVTTDGATSSQPVTTDVATSSQPVTKDGATSSQPVTTDGATSSQPVTTDGATSSQPVITDGATSSQPVTTDGATSSQPVTTDGATSSQPVITDGATSSQPVTKDGATSSQPVTTDGATSSQPVITDGATSSQPVTKDGATSSQPVTTDGVTSSQPVTTDGATSSQPVTKDGATSSQPVTTEPSSGDRRCDDVGIQTDIGHEEPSSGDRMCDDVGIQTDIGHEERSHDFLQGLLSRIGNKLIWRFWDAGRVTVSRLAAHFQGERRPLLQQQNSGFGSLFEPRRRMGDIAHVVVIIILGAIIIFQEDKESIIFEAIVLSLLLMFGELLHRTCLFVEELQHMQTRYEGTWKEVFRSTFGNKFTLLIGLAATIFLPLIVYTGCETPFRQHHLLASLLYFVLRLQALSPVEESEIRERHFNAAEALALSYYYYLKEKLPQLDCLIGQSEFFRYKLTHRKLFILLPRHCYPYNHISYADGRVKFAGNLPSWEKNLFGINGYSFKHSVYRLEMPRADGGIDEHLILMEYAAPLANLYDMFWHSDASLSFQELDYQVVLFVCKLKEILNSCPECRGKYQLVTFGKKTT